MTTLRSLLNLIRLTRQRGPRYALRWLRWRWYERSMERRLGIDTEVTAIDRTRENYGVTDYATLKMIFDGLGVTSDDVLVDFGCGKGRAIIFACQYPFKEILGIEYANELYQAALVNIRNSGVDPERVYVGQRNAAVFPTPTEASIFFFCNPFTGPTLASVLENIRQSIEAHPRQVRIVCADWSLDSAFVRELTACPWVRLDRREQNPVTGMWASWYTFSAKPLSVGDELLAACKRAREILDEAIGRAEKTT